VDFAVFGVSICISESNECDMCGKTIKILEPFLTIISEEPEFFCHKCTDKILGPLAELHSILKNLQPEQKEGTP